jgi:putative photosynthetic complex assembly protein 2
MDALLAWTLPPLVAAAVWWLGTITVMALGTLALPLLRLSAPCGVVLSLAALLCVQHTLTDLRPAGAYAAFVCAVLLWGTLELAFLGGWLAGPRRTGATAARGGLAHFAQAAGAVLWHQLAVLVVLAGLAWQAWGQPNTLGLQTFAVLAVMRLSAQLNLYFGVGFDGQEFLPQRLAYLASYFHHSRHGNALWPWSMGLGALAGAVWVSQAAGAFGPLGQGARVGALLLASLMLLALAEHAFMRWPVPHGRLWQWALPTPGAAASTSGAKP